MDGCHVVDGTSVAVAVVGRMDEEEEGTWKWAKSAWPSFELCSLWHRRERRMRMLAAKGVSLRHRVSDTEATFTEGTHYAGQA